MPGTRRARAQRGLPSLNLLPPRGPQRRLAAATLATSVGFGAFAASSVLFFTRGVGVTPAEVGMGLAVAGGVGIAGSVVSGELAGRCGVREALFGLSAAQAALFTAYCWVSSFWAFLLVLCALAFAESGAGVARNAVIAAVTAGGDRVGLKTRLRTVFNCGAAAGAALASIPLALDTRSAYLAVPVFCALLAVVTSGVVLTLPRAVVPPQPERKTSRVNAYSDLPFVALSLVCGLFATHHSLLVLALPLWLADETAAPHSLIGLLFLMNTVLAIGLQVWAGRGVRTVQDAGAIARRGGYALCAACVLLALAALVPAWPAAVVLVAGVVLLTLGELWTAVAAWALAFELAPEHAHSQYQGAFAVGMSLESIVGPLLATGLVLSLGQFGWLIAGTTFLALALLTPRVAGFAATTRAAITHIARHRATASPLVDRLLRRAP